jgi:hypothetical protein
MEAGGRGCRGGSVTAYCGYSRETRLQTVETEVKGDSKRTNERGPSWLHCKENPVYVFIFLELRGLSPNFYIHVSVSDLYIPRISPHISCSRKGRSIVGIYKSLTDT